MFFFVKILLIFGAEGCIVTMMYFLSLIYIFMNKVTCYQRLVQTIVEDARNGMNFDYEMAAFPGFERRGHSESEFRDWVKTVKWVLNILNTHDGSLNQKKDFCRQSISAAGVYKVPFYRLREEELQIIASAERFGRGDAGEVLRYGDRNVVSYDYRHIPCHEGGRKDILLVFSGAPESATKAAEAVYHYVRNHRTLPDGVMFLGLEDNQNMTEFNPAYKIRKNSEYRMYLRQMLMLGIPKALLGKLLMTPKDTSTAENIALIKETLAHYHVDEDVNLICVTYPLYQMRVATELSFGLREEKNVWLRIADIEPKAFTSAAQGVFALSGKVEDENIGRRITENLRIFSYDRIGYDGQLADLTLANCVAHLFREHGKSRFALPHLGSYPEEYKALAPLFLAYSYPNVVNELCGTNETVAAVLKVVRALMIDAYDEGASGKAWDRQQLVNTLNTGYKLIAEGLASPAVIARGRMMSEEQFLKAVVAFQNIR